MRLRVCGLCLGAAGSFFIAGCGAPFLVGSPSEENCDGYCTVVEEKSIKAFACDLDKLEKQIEWHGSVVPKIPDIWGEARLAKHRQEFEAQMVSQLGLFTETLQGASAISDQSFLVSASALSAAISGPPAFETDPTTGKVTTQVIQVPPTAGPPEALNGVDFGDNTVRNQVSFNSALTAKVGEKQALSISLEPTEVLAQRARYLDFLNQLRRTNEGDDTSDAPGYSLNLVRIPVSVLPGKCTDVGHGAEITFTMTPIVGEELCPQTFRNLLPNDIADTLGLPMTRVLDVNLQPLAAGGFDFIDLDDEDRRKIRQIFRGQQIERERAVAGVPLAPSEEDNVDLAIWLANKPAATADSRSSATPRASTLAQHGLGSVAAAKRRSAASVAGQQDRATWLVKQMTQGPSKVSKAFTSSGAGNPSPVSPKTTLPNYDIDEMYGPEFLFEIANALALQYGREIQDKRYVHLPDTRAFLKTQADAAYKFLEQPAFVGLWSEFCTPQLAHEVLGKNRTWLVQRRDAFRRRLRDIERSIGAPKIDNENRLDYTPTAAFAWGVLVDAAVLTDRLLTDYRESAAARGAPTSTCQWLDFAYPSPSPEARKAFADYVSIRWPIHVFALDPSNQEQNIADLHSMRRETQLALSLAFATGRIGASNFTRWARRIEMESQTIALNRTQVGFSHGDRTFGWRFYPRFQTPDVSSNLEVFFRHQLIGGPNLNQRLRDRRLEPGIRECVAIVLMPSFVPNVTVESVSNWFSLTNPKHKKQDHTRAVALGRSVRTLQNCSGSLVDCDQYRGTDTAVLHRRVEQLESRLPIQSQIVQVPQDNTLGGFAMFNHGVTDLGPEIFGFYGAPGVTSGDTPTTLFLVGKNFSTLRSEVIIGNVGVAPEVPDSSGGSTKNVHFEVLSREIIRVTVNGKTFATTRRGDPGGQEYVSLHVATPYGVTTELLVPVVRSPQSSAAAAEGYTLEKGTLIVNCGATRNSATGKFDLANLTFNDNSDVVVSAIDALGTVSEHGIFGLSFDFGGGNVTVVKINMDRVRGKLEPEAASLKAAVDAIGGFVATKKSGLTEEELKDGIKSVAAKLTPAAKDSATGDYAPIGVGQPVVPQLQVLFRVN